MSLYKRKSPCTVISKYFMQNTVMDDSSDFQQKKKLPKGPKSKKATSTKNPKKIKGQKDIRAVLKKNELITYAKDFDKVCQLSGVDVDSEQLQLVIALSKSLENKTSSSEGESSQTSKSQDRIRKIRTTLQEYGFKVPEIKITTGNRKLRKRKKYKLLLATELGQKQMIYDKYSQVLFRNIINFSESDSLKYNLKETDLYYKATSASYDLMKSNDIFYVDNLLEKSPNRFGNLLKDWSEIPGRPVSPTQEAPDLKFNEMDYLQDELDVILSGNLERVHKITNRFVKRKEVLQINNIDEDCRVIAVNRLYATKNKEVNSEEKTKDKTQVETKENDKVEIIDLESPQDNLPVSQNIRSCSPDIFGDEASIVDTTNVDTRSQKLTTENAKFIDIMDLTECVPVALQQNKAHELVEDAPTVSQLSQTSNVTSRKSNDFMEITDCVATSSQPIKVHEENIDLTQEKKSSSLKDDEQLQSIDLTQSSNSNDDTLPFVQIGTQPKLFDGKVKLSGKENDNIHDEYHDTNTSKENRIETPTVEDADTKNMDIIEENKIQKTLSQSFFEEYNYDHSDYSSKEQVLTPKGSKNQSDEIDLTQSSDSHEATAEENAVLEKNDNVSIDYDEIYHDIDVNNASEYYINTESTPVKNEVEILRSISEDIDKFSKSDNYLQNSNNTIANSSKTSEVFEISDNELNYSLHQSKRHKIENFDYGGISVLYELPDVQSFSKSSNSFDSTNAEPTNDSLLPEVDINSKGADSSTGNSKSMTDKALTPRLYSKNASVKTPSNSEYIIKTDEVTPMLDYASMSTPERNIELEKYGLKPFKRKRAVQLLTHLYNQTHPLIESCPNNIPSPTKKRKIDSNSEQTAKVAKSPQKITEDRVNVRDDKENSNYEVTNECPEINNIQCTEEDWIFQKREKAKVHSCRVPLHIAFHNYVTCRRRLREAILRYEPINIDVIHKELAASGHRYDPKDLLKFMDKKCITVKTMDNNSRNKR